MEEYKLSLPYLEETANVYEVDVVNLKFPSRGSWSKGPHSGT
jgi:hypothetical protein